MSAVQPQPAPRQSVRPSAHESALLRLMPSAEQALLLAACLHQGDAAARAWRDFAAQVHDPKVYFETDQTGLKGLLPFVETRLAANGIDAGKPFHTYARVALVREELRSRIYAEILESVLAALDAAGISAVLLKGGALSATVYPTPSARHNHAIDLLVGVGQMSAARAVLSRVQFSPKPVTSGAAWHHDMRHSSGLALGLHTQPLFLPQFAMPLAEILARTRAIRIGGRSVKVLSPEDSLVHVLGHAAYSRSRANLRWACDAYYLLAHDAASNWPRVAETATRSHLALPMLTSLQWLRERLAAPIAGERLDDLRQRAVAFDAIAAEGVYAALLHSTLSRSRAFKAFDSSWRARWGFLRFSAMPSLRYVSWRHNIERGWQVPLYYADRPRRLVARLAAAAVRRLAGQAAADGADASARNGAA